MRNTTLLAKEYLDEEELLEKLTNLAKQHKYRIEIEDLYGLGQIDCYKDISDDEFYLIEFWIITEEENFPERYNINGEDYKTALHINHDSEVLSDVNVLIKEIMEMYPDLYVTDEMYEDFYNLDDINSGDVAAWLKV